MAPLTKLLAFAAVIHTIAAVPYGKPFEKVKRQAGTSAGTLQVDLGYEVYEGVANSSTRLNVFKG